MEDDGDCDDADKGDVYGDLDDADEKGQDVGDAKSMLNRQVRECRATLLSAMERQGIWNLAF